MKAYIFIISIILVLFIITGQSGCEIKKECQLSLCDCRCHEKGQTPEELEGKLCGINCLGEYGITGCEYADGSCRETYEIELQNESNTSYETSGLSASAAKSGCGCGS